jgi:hypothetical protein
VKIAIRYVFTVSALIELGWNAAIATFSSFSEMLRAKSKSSEV